MIIIAIIIAMPIYRIIGCVYINGAMPLCPGGNVNKQNVLLTDILKYKQGEGRGGYGCVSEGRRAAGIL